MRREIDQIIETMQQVMDGQPWFGRPLFSLLNEVHPADVFKKPNDEGHSLIELVYHMITWTEFTLHRVEGRNEPDLAAIESQDWRNIDPMQHTWSKGLETLRLYHDEIIRLLHQKDDSFLDQPVEYREYNFRLLLNGLIQHDIYHLGQIAYLTKWLIPA